MKFMNLLKTGLLLTSRHKSAIMAGGAIASGIAGIVLSVKATIKSVKDVEKATEEKQKAAQKEMTDSEFEEPKKDVELTKGEIVKITWKHFIPVFVATAATTTFIICAHRVDAKRIAAAASALALSEKMNRELQNKTIEEFGREKASEIQQAILKKNPDSAKAYESGFIQKTNEGKIKSNGKVYECIPSDSYRSYCWFRDEISGREFWSTRNEVEYAVNRAMRDALNGGCPIMTLNGWYQWLDLDTITMGDKLGWDLDRGQTLDVSFEADIRDTGEPCLIIRYSEEPRVV